MPQLLTFSPEKVRAGDKLISIITPDSSKNLKTDLRLGFFTVTRVIETVKRVDATRLKKRFQFTLESDMPMPGAITSVEVTHKAHLFHTVEDAQKYIRDIVTELGKACKAHDQRQSDLAGVLYAAPSGVEYDDDDDDGGIL